VLPWARSTVSSVPLPQSGETPMTHKIHKDMKIISADGIPIGVVDHVGAHRIKLMTPTEGSHKGHHHYISVGLVAGVEDNVVRLSANADVAVTFEEEA
jgi:hypothetical protein